MFRILLILPFFKRLKNRGLLSKQARRQYAIYRFFKLFFGLNREAKFAINFTSVVLKPENVHLGAEVEKSFVLSGNCYFQGINGIFIGDRTIFAPGVKVISADHEQGELSTHKKEEPIRIGNDCWIGANAVILPGVTIGDHTIVAAGAVVTKSFPNSNQVLKGVPAQAFSKQ